MAESDTDNNNRLYMGYIRIMENKMETTIS